MTPATLSRSVEDYLKAIYALNERGEAAGTSKLARTLDVQPASVSGMVRRLAEDGLVEHEPYRGVRLTEEGSREALRILRRHRIIEVFLVERLGFAWEDVHDEAERLEHAASDTLIDRMAEALGNPANDPHGSPIPTSGGEIDTTFYRPLNEIPPGTRVRIQSVSDEDPRSLRYFESVSLVPGTRALVRDVADRDGPVTLVIDGHEEPLTVSAAAARKVRVSEPTATST